MRYAGTISNLRALAYSFMCGNNNNEVNELELLAGCNRFGVENPVQTITRRLALFGNEKSLIEKLKAGLANKIEIKQLGSVE